jgi:hypothetical protein
MKWRYEDAMPPERRHGMTMSLALMTVQRSRGTARK